MLNHDQPKLNCADCEMNALNREQSREMPLPGRQGHELTPTAPPDLIQNLLSDEEKEKNYNKSVFIKDVNEYSNGHLNNFAGVNDDRCNSCNGLGDSSRKGSLPYPVRSANIGVAVPETKHDKRVRKRKRFMRGLCCMGWIFCCPVYFLCWAMREAPVDEEDLRDDDCYPCFH